MKRIILFSLLFAGCNSKPSAVDIAQHQYDSTHRASVRIQKECDCEIELINKGVLKDSAQKKCEDIWGK